MRTVPRVLAVVVSVAVVVAGCSGGSSAVPSSTTQVQVTAANGTADDPPSEDVADDTDGDTDRGGPRRDVPPLEVPIPEPEGVTLVGVDGGTIETSGVPNDLLELVRRGVEAGSFSEAEGIARALDGLSGRSVPTVGLGPDDVLEPGITALVRAGADLLASGDLAGDDASWLTASLGFFTPTQAVLDLISLPASDTGVSGFASVAFRPTASSSGGASAPAGDPECSDVGSMGFPGMAESALQCYRYQEITIEGHRLRVYYPVAWQADAERMGWISDAFDGIATSVVVYSDLNVTIGDINAVFGLVGSGTARAAQNYFDLDEACPITIYPAGTGRGDGRLQQTLAHETFHCVQDWNFATAPYSTHQWWLEGSATFFSNVVYPALNDEHQWTSSFDTGSLANNPTEMAYENTVFFQYYANVKGVGGVIRLLEAVSSGGASLASLAAIDGIDEIWQNFASAFVADAVFDPGGGTVGGATATNGVVDIDRIQTVNYNAFPLQVNRWFVGYTEAKHYRQTVNDGTRYAVVRAPNQHDLGAWTTMPGDVRPTCDAKREYLVVATTVDQPRTLVNEVVSADDAECDPCLIGTWAMQLSSFSDYIVTLVKSGGVEIPNLDLRIDGNYDFELRGDGGLRTVRKLSVTPVVAGVGAPTTVIEGTETGSYHSDGTTLSVTGVSGDANASIGEISASVFNGPDGASTKYSCDADALTLTTLPYGPLEFIRIDRPPEPEPVIIDTGG